MPRIAQTERDTYISVDTGKMIRGSDPLAEMRDAICRRHIGIRTEQAYLGWDKRQNQSSLTTLIPWIKSIYI